MTVLTYKGPPSARKEAQKELASLYTNDAGRRRRGGVAAAAAAREQSKQGSRQLNVLLTTYEYVMRDRAVLRRVGWEYIVVDEGHRMKNVRSRRPGVLWCFHFIVTHRLRERRSWVVSFSISRPFGPI